MTEPVRRFSRPLSARLPLVSVVGGVALVFLSLPIVVLLVRGISTRGWEGLPGSGISEAITLSLFTTLISSMLIMAFGTPLAYIFARRQFRGKRLLNIFIELPIVLPPAVAGLALLVTFGRRGLFGPLLDTVGLSLAFTTTAVILAQTFVSAPFFIRAAQIGFENIPREVEEAARVDGAAGWSLLRFITLPLANRALVSGLILSWARGLGEFGATILFAGSIQGRTQTMPLLIYNVLERNLDAAIWTGLILIVLAFCALVISQALKSREPAPAETR